MQSKKRGKLVVQRLCMIHRIKRLRVKRRVEGQLNNKKRINQ